MNSSLHAGILLISTRGQQYQVLEKLGEGGQGEVYKVVSNGNSFALKWYFKKCATKKQRDILENLMLKGSPDECFLWPTDIIDKGNVFGYVMPLRTSEYKGIVDLMKRRIDPSFKALAIAGFNISRSFQKLHSMGYCYCDISFGNTFFDPFTGNVLICDNDNVIVNKSKPPIIGTQRFMAPEVVRGDANPSTDSDLFSMAVLLFYLFMVHHPLEGANESKIKALDIHAMNQLYGKTPVFIWDPEDKSNRPVKGLHDNAIIFWDIYPKFFRDLFITSFTDGLRKPQKRVLENRWQSAFIKLSDSIMFCPRCESEVFFDTFKKENGTGHLCWNCQTSVNPPPVLKVGKNLILMTKRTKIYEHHLKDNNCIDKIIGEMVQNPSDPQKWGLKNVSGEEWIYQRPDGSQTPVEKGKAAVVAKGTKIVFGSVTGEFI